MGGWLNGLCVLAVMGGIPAAFGQSVSDEFQVELELYDRQTKQSIYYKFDPTKNAPPRDKPQVINLLRWQSLRAERNTSILVRSAVTEGIPTVSIRFRGGDGGVEMTYRCGADLPVMPSANYHVYVQEKLRYEARITHNCAESTAATNGG